MPTNSALPRRAEPNDLTAREIAECLKARWPDVDTTVIRIRHWTGLGMLSASNARFPGRGKQREYEAATVIDVAVMGALADLGMPLAGQQARYIRFACAQARAHYGEWLKNPDRRFFLAVEHVANKAGIGPAVTVREAVPMEGFPPGTITITPVGETAITINLTQLFQRIRRVA